MRRFMWWTGGSWQVFKPKLEIHGQEITESLNINCV